MIDGLAATAVLLMPFVGGAVSAMVQSPTLVSSHHRSPSDIQAVIRGAWGHFRVCYDKTLRN